MSDQPVSHGDSVDRGERFEFGKNWTKFLATLTSEKVAAAERSLSQMLEVDSLVGKRFVDIGSGSGLFSLAAHRLGATVTSFDYDPQSVACTRELKRRYFASSERWAISEGSALDSDYLRTLGQFDIVYSWGVLHHTGRMWAALENVHTLVATRGTLFIAIYNDQGGKSHLWWFIKSFYNHLPRILRAPFAWTVTALTRIAVLVKYIFKLKPMIAIAPLFADSRDRGMSAKYDELDWIGGFPFEFAGFDSLTAYFIARGFNIINAKRNTGWGCHELALRRTTCAE